MTILETAAVTFIKTSCLLFFGRIFRTAASKVSDIALWAMLTIVIVGCLSFVFGFMFICGTHSTGSGRAWTIRLNVEISQ